jgi:hypothetical protein
MLQVTSAQAPYVHTIWMQWIRIASVFVPNKFRALPRLPRLARISVLCPRPRLLRRTGDCSTPIVNFFATQLFLCSALLSPLGTVTSFETTVKSTNTHVSRT